MTAPQRDVPARSRPTLPSATWPVLPPLASDDDFQAGINTTPLVDVMLVLLIIFLITIPVVAQTVPVQLPQEQSQTLPPRQRTITLSLTASGALFWDDQQLNLDDLRDRLRQWSAQTPPPAIHLRADRQTPYRQVSRLLALCQQEGLTSLSFLLDPTSPHLLPKDPS